MKKVRLYIKRNMTHTAPTEVPAWEVAILNALHGRDNIERVCEVECDVPIPSVLAEAERLTARYGINEADGIPHFVKIYGAEDVGLDRLAEAMAKVVGEEGIVMVHEEDEYVDPFANPPNAVAKGAKGKAGRKGQEATAAT